jgi:hypothetical protein
MKWKALMALAALYLSSGCGALQQTSGEMVRKTQNIVAPSDFDLEGRMTKANTFLMNFPTEEEMNRFYSTEIVRSVDKYLVPGASKTIIVVRQTHNLPRLSKEAQNEVISVQEDIYSVCEYLRKNPDTKLRKVHDEGFISERLAEMHIDLCRFIDKIFAYAAKDLREEISRLDRRLMFDADDNLRQVVQEKRKSLQKVEGSKGVAILHGAVLKLGYEGKVKIMPAEKAKWRNAYDTYYGVTDLRENDFLEIAARQRGCYVFVVFGGAHAWGGTESCGKGYDLAGRASDEDNLAKWNKEHPEQKFSLIEITPAGYIENLSVAEGLKASIENKKGEK